MTRTGQTRSSRILVVDDEADFRNAMAFSLRRMGYEILTAANGNEAFEMVSTQRIDIVISDIRMPNGDGVDFLVRVKKLGSETPFILLATGHADVSVEEARSKGAEALFSKPLNRKKLNDVIVGLLGSPERIRREDLTRTDPGLKVGLNFSSVSDPVEAKVVIWEKEGMTVALPQGLYPNVCDTAGFRIVVQDQAPAVQGTGTVCWIRMKDAPDFPAGCGIEFTSLNEADKQRVFDFMGSNVIKTS